MVFKSFKPKKYSRHSLYKKGPYCGFNTNGMEHKELCFNCGYPYGQHFDVIDRCPTKKDILKRSKTLKPVKHGIQITEKEPLNIGATDIETIERIKKKK